MNNLIINEDSLIVLVQQNDLLYNKSNQDYKNVQKKKEVWAAIGLVVGASGDACSKRWASLRDKYCREVRRMACSSGSGAVPQSKWQHFESLSFLSGHMRGGRQRSNFSFETEDEVFPPWECLEDSEPPTVLTSLPPAVSHASTPLPSPVLAMGLSDSLTSATTQSQKRRREEAHNEHSEAFKEVTESIKTFLQKDDTPTDMRAHSFGKFVESYLAGMEANKQMKLITDITQMLLAAQNELNFNKYTNGK